MKIIESFYGKELLFSILYMSYYPQLDSHARHKGKLVVDSSDQATKKELDHGTGVDACDLVAKKDFVGLKAEVDKLDINKIVNVPTCSINL